MSAGRDEPHARTRGLLASAAILSGRLRGPFARCDRAVRRRRDSSCPNRGRPKLHWQLARKHPAPIRLAAPTPPACGADPDFKSGPHLSPSHSSLHFDCLLESLKGLCVCREQARVCRGQCWVQRQARNEQRSSRLT